jgi:hypothetical protein
MAAYEVSYATSRLAEAYEKFGGDVKAGPVVTGPATDSEFWHHLSTYAPMIIEYRSADQCQIFWFAGGEGFRVSYDYWAKDENGQRVGATSYERVAICVHEWDPQRSRDTRTGWHERHCMKCGYARSWDSSG